MPQIPVNYQYNCTCDSKPPGQYAYTEAVTATSLVVGGELIDYYLFLTSRPYPLQQVEMVEVGSDAERGLFLTAYVEGTDNAADVVSGLLRNALKTATMAPEAIDAEADVVSGSLRPAFKSFVVPDEAIEVGAALLSGSLRPALVSTDMDAEAVTVSATVISGRLM